MGTQDITSYKIVNPSAGNDYYTVTGGTISTDTQPTINKGRATNLGTSASSPSVNMTRVDMGDRGRTIFGSQVIISSRQSVQHAFNSNSNISITSVASFNGLARYTDSGHPLSEGDSIIVSDSTNVLSGPQRVVQVISSSIFVTDKPYTSGAGSMTYKQAPSHFATMTVGNYLARRLSGVTIGGTANNLLRSGGSDYGIRRSIHKIEHGRTTKTATAIRAGNWNMYSGVWSTAPTDANDSIGKVDGNANDPANSDHAAAPTRAIPGELVYRQSGAQTAGTAAQDGVQLDDYTAKTG